MACEVSPADTVSLDEFLPYVMYQVSGLPAEVAAHTLRLAAIELAKHTGLLERTIHMTAQQGVEFYALDLGPDVAVSSVRQVTVNGCCYAPYRELCDCLPNRHFYYDKQRGLMIDPAGEDRARGIEVIAKVVPGQDTCELDRCLYDVHAEVVSDGAMARIMNIPTAPWYEPNSARAFARRFNEGRSAAAKIAKKRSVSAPTMIKSRRWA